MREIPLSYIRLSDIRPMTEYRPFRQRAVLSASAEKDGKKEGKENKATAQKHYDVKQDRNGQCLVLIKV